MVDLLAGDLEVPKFEPMIEAPCIDTPTAVFYPEKHSSLAVTQKAMVRCVGACPVRAECLQYALDHHELGWWAGTSERGRRAIRKTGLTAIEAIENGTADIPRRGRPPKDTP